MERSSVDSETIWELYQQRLGGTPPNPLELYNFCKQDLHMTGFKFSQARKLFKKFSKEKSSTPRRKKRSTDSSRNSGAEDEERAVVVADSHLTLVVSQPPSKKKSRSKKSKGALSTPVGMPTLPSDKSLQLSSDEAVTSAAVVSSGSGLRSGDESDGDSSNSSVSSREESSGETREKKKARRKQRRLKKKLKKEKKKAKKEQKRLKKLQREQQKEQQAVAAAVHLSLVDYSSGPAVISPRSQAPPSSLAAKREFHPVLGANSSSTSMISIMGADTMEKRRAEAAMSPLLPDDTALLLQSSAEGLHASQDSGSLFGAASDAGSDVKSDRGTLGTQHSDMMSRFLEDGSDDEHKDVGSRPARLSLIRPISSIGLNWPEAGSKKTMTRTLSHGYEVSGVADSHIPRTTGGRDTIGSGGSGSSGGIDHRLRLTGAKTGDSRPKSMRTAKKDDVMPQAFFTDAGPSRRALGVPALPTGVGSSSMDSSDSGYFMSPRSSPKDQASLLRGRAPKKTGTHADVTDILATAVAHARKRSASPMSRPSILQQQRASSAMAGIPRRRKSGTGSGSSVLSPVLAAYTESLSIPPDLEKSVIQMQSDLSELSAFVRDSERAVVDKSEQFDRLLSDYRKAKKKSKKKRLAAKCMMPPATEKEIDHWGEAYEEMCNRVVSLDTEVKRIDWLTQKMIEMEREIIRKRQSKLAKLEQFTDRMRQTQSECYALNDSIQDFVTSLHDLRKRDRDWKTEQLVISASAGVATRSGGASAAAASVATPMSDGAATDPRRDSITSIPEEFICPITMVLMSDPVVTADGHVYERQAIEDWFAENDISPLTGAPLANKTLIPLYILRSQVERFRLAHPHLSEYYTADGTG